MPKRKHNKYSSSSEEEYRKHKRRSRKKSKQSANQKTKRNLSEESSDNDIPRRKSQSTENPKDVKQDTDSESDTRNSSDRHSSDRHSSNRHSSERHLSGRRSSEHSSSDRTSSDRSSSDRRSLDRHSSDRHSSDPHPSNRRSSARQKHSENSSDSESSNSKDQDLIIHAEADGLSDSSSQNSTCRKNSGLKKDDSENTFSKNKEKQIQNKYQEKSTDREFSGRQSSNQNRSWDKDKYNSKHKGEEHSRYSRNSRSRREEDVYSSSDEEQHKRRISHWSSDEERQETFHSSDEAERRARYRGSDDELDRRDNQRDRDNWRNKNDRREKQGRDYMQERRDFQKDKRDRYRDMDKMRDERGDGDMWKNNDYRERNFWKNDGDRGRRDRYMYKNRGQYDKREAYVQRTRDYEQEPRERDMWRNSSDERDRRDNWRNRDDDRGWREGWRHRDDERGKRERDMWWKEDDMGRNRNSDWDLNSERGRRPMFRGRDNRGRGMWRNRGRRGRFMFGYRNRRDMYRHNDEHQDNEHRYYKYRDSDDYRTRRDSWRNSEERDDLSDREERNWSDHDRRTKQSEANLKESEEKSRGDASRETDKEDRSRDDDKKESDKEDIAKGDGEIESDKENLVEHEISSQNESTKETENTDNKTVQDNSVKKPGEEDSIISKTGGAYIPPAKLKMMQAQISDKNSVEYQRIAWEALKKSVNGLINKVNVSNIAIIVRDLFQENVIRGRGILSRSIMQAQAASPTFAHVYAAFVAIINSKFPQIGELILRRLIIQFRRGFRRNDKQACFSSTRFIAHLINQQVAHEVIALEILTLLLENATDHSVEIAIGFLKESGRKLTDVSPRGMNSVFERLRNILHEGDLNKRVQYMIEVMFAIRKDDFKDHPSVISELDLVEEVDQFTHLITLEEATDGEDILNVFQHDTNYEDNEEKYSTIKKEMLAGSSSSSEGDSSGSESEDDEDENESNEGEESQQILDNTETNLVALRRTIYLTIQSSLDFEECAHKLIKLELKPGQVMELCHMILDCCAQQRTYEKFYGLLAQRFCQLNKTYVEPYEEIFKSAYDTIHRFETNKLRNVAKFFAHLLYTDAISWMVLAHIKLNEEDTTSSSRIFIKILFQELCEYMGLPKLNERVKDVTLQEAFDGLFPRDNPHNTRFAINFFTSIGLGGLTDELREHLKNMPKTTSSIPQISVSSDSSSKSSSSDESESSDSVRSSSESSSSESESNSERRRKKKKKRRSSKKKKRS